MNETGTERDPLDLLAEEFAGRHRRGERPSVEEYAQRHPELAGEIRDLFPALLVMERLKPGVNEPTSPFADSHSGPTPLVQPERLGEFRIVREIGHGGMGVVYEAVQESLGRRVALKVLPVLPLTNTTWRERFRREAQAAARLQHPNIVPVYGIFETDNIHYYAMQYVEGRGLDRVLADWQQGQSDATLSPDHHRRIAALGLQVADALAYAHQQGVLHRDVKPSNLLLDERGNVWVTDFGLARTEGSDELTGTGDVVGTLRFMAPERFDGESLPQSDVWSLGLTLYELLTFRPAFEDASKGRLIDHILHEAPVPPRQIDPTIPRDLETIVLKCLAKEPLERYRDAGELADDLRNFAADRPIRARRVSRVEKAWRWCAKNPATVGLSAAVALLLLLLAVVLMNKEKRPMPGASAEAPLPDPGGLNQFRDRQEGAIFVQVEGQAGETIWGTGVYTNDSPLEAVVVHAGLLRVGEKGIVKVTWLPGQQAYSGSTQNGVTSHPYGEWHGSYRVELVRKIPPPAPTPDPGQLQNYRTQVGQRFVFEVTGSAEGPVWGTDIYTDDSRLATAAVHAGLLQVGQRGRLRVTILPGQASYPGSTRNGVTSAEWQQWAGSYRIERVAP